MRKSNNLLSLPIISLEEGKEIGRIKKLLINPSIKKIGAILIEEKGWLKKSAKVVLYEKIRSIGKDAVTVEKGTVAQAPDNLPEINNLVEADHCLVGAKVVVENGALLGVVEDYWVDTKTGEILFLEISGKLWENLFRGPCRLDLEHVRTIGEKLIIAKEGSEKKVVSLKN